MTLLKLKLPFPVLAFCSFVAVSQASPSALCPESIATTSVYFTPTVQNMCHSNKPCDRFYRRSNVQGTGRLSGNKLYTHYSIKKKNQRTRTVSKVISAKNCPTAFGAAGKCLIPYLTVAADRKYYQMGDIIEMPNLKGRLINLPGGKSFIHPGFLIVQDVGGDIKGKNRFDMYTGLTDFKDADNAFGTYSQKDMVFTDTSQCDDRKKFTVVRRGTVNYESSLAALESAYSNSLKTNDTAIVSRYPAAGNYMGGAQ